MGEKVIFRVLTKNQDDGVSDKSVKLLVEGDYHRCDRAT